MDKAELKQNIRKVKKFLKERDYSKIDIGIELIRSLNEPNIFKELLEGTLIEEDGVLKKIRHLLYQVLQNLIYIIVSRGGVKLIVSPCTKELK